MWIKKLKSYYNPTLTSTRYLISSRLQGIMIYYLSCMANNSKDTSKIYTQYPLDTRYLPGIVQVCSSEYVLSWAFYEYVILD